MNGESRRSGRPRRPNCSSSSQLCCSSAGAPVRRTRPLPRPPSPLDPHVRRRTVVSESQPLVGAGFSACTVVAWSPSAATTLDVGAAGASAAALLVAVKPSGLSVYRLHFLL